ncbi:hypothetical protein AB0O91_06940 [Kitasatospora sp. NPDC089797]|uniref:hypothetical protein n=1 Tax=Kitasatospora sp. NPDC089797 TaxID=3155298 RepID=UPI003438BD69
MTAARAGQDGPADLVDLICRAVAAGDGLLVEALLTVLEAVADAAVLQRLSEAMTAAASPGRPGPGGPRAGPAQARTVQGPRPCRPAGGPAPGRRT